MQIYFQNARQMCLFSSMCKDNIKCNEYTKNNITFVCEGVNKFNTENMESKVMKYLIHRDMCYIDDELKLIEDTK